MCAERREHTGYHWRNELVNNLLDFVRDGVDRRLLDNVVSRYVPVFFPIEIPPQVRAQVGYLFVLCLMSGGEKKSKI